MTWVLLGSVLALTLGVKPGLPWSLGEVGVALGFDIGVGVGNWGHLAKRRV